MRANMRARSSGIFVKKVAAFLLASIILGLNLGGVFGNAIGGVFGNAMGGVSYAAKIDSKVRVTVNGDEVGFPDQKPFIYHGFSRRLEIPN